jgi:hypothetical protein
MAEEIFKVLGAGGDVGILAVAFAFYKLDRRIIKLEIVIENLMKGIAHG